MVAVFLGFYDFHFYFGVVQFAGYCLNEKWCVRFVFFNSLVDFYNYFVVRRVLSLNKLLDVGLYRLFISQYSIKLPNQD